jgi:hypothetical protein
VAPGCAGSIVLVQFEVAGGVGAVGADGAVGAAGGAGGVKLNGKILTSYYAFQAREADQSFAISNCPKVSAGRHSGIPEPASGTI